MLAEILRRSGEFVPQVMCATARGSDDVIEPGKVRDEPFFRCLGLLKTPAIRHRLAAASLVERVDDIHFQLLQKLQSGDADFRIEKVDITRNHQGNLHSCFSSSPAMIRASLRRVTATDWSSPDRRVRRHDRLELL